jgi:uncharacterized protein (TIGR02452 family)
MSLAGVAKETLEIVERGSYTAPSGAEVRLQPAVDRAVRGTVLYDPAQLDQMIGPWERASSAPRIEVTDESTAVAARRLVEVEREPHVAALNFASAKNPGGGFLGGAKAQEEDLARCSALYPCLLTQPRYYEVHRAERSLLYTDHVIYSPEVPFFRGEQLELLEQSFCVSIITAAAPNAGEVLKREPDTREQIRAVLAGRAAKVLTVAAAQGQRALVLGAWGCGVFRNDPRDVAEIFAGWLAHPRFVGVFDRVVFAIYDRSRSRSTLCAFSDRFAAG